MKVLIYKSNNYLKPVGGPAGYLYNLREGLKRVNEQDFFIEFLPDKPQNSGFKAQLKRIGAISWVTGNHIYKTLKHYFYIRAQIRKQEECTIDLKQYDAIHFHTTLDLYRMRAYLEHYNGKVLLSPHSPVPLFVELLEKMGILGKIDLYVRARLEEIDRHAFMRADNILFPCGYSDEAYENLWPQYRKIKEDKRDSFIYLLSGVNAKETTCSRKEFRGKWGIPEDAFVIGYVGRHNKTKGYDKLLSLGTKMLKDNTQLYFLIGGEEAPMKGLPCDRWIETGWLRNPQDLLNAADVFVLLNETTFFDLVLLEAISLGVPIVASNTGGNKLFKGEPGIRLFDDAESCISEIEKIMSMRSDEIALLRKENSELYRAFFSIEIFAEQYIKLLKRLLE